MNRTPFSANTPHLDTLFKSDLYTQLKAHGMAVGLPSDDDMGNSEVGHNAIGAGRIFDQGARLVNKALKSGQSFRQRYGKISQNALSAEERFISSACYPTERPLAH
jgi:bisphosphoglycerate-independent phosphoglycerate mutase (AlkP superfamily)